MKNNHIISKDSLYSFYLAGFFVILSLPLWAFPPLFFPPEWGKSIVFRTVISIILFLFIWQLTSKNQPWQDLIEKCKSQKKAVLTLAALFLLLFLSTLFSSDVLFSLWASPHRSGGFADFASYILFPIILFLAVKDKDWKKLWDFAFLIGDGVVLFAAIQYFNLLPKIFIAYEGRPPATLSNPILLAIFFIFLIFPALSSGIREKSNKKFFYWVSLLLFSFGVLISGSRAAYIGIILGGFYFLLFYPSAASLLKKIKITVSSLLLFAALAVVFINVFPSSLNFLKNNQRIYLILKDRLSIQAAAQDLAGTRFSAWQMFFDAAAHKPLLGWGPENQQIGFDKSYRYDPSLESLVNSSENWWDRAHNIFLDLSVAYGIPFLIVFIFLLGLLFWRLRKTKHKTEYSAVRIEAHAIQSIFIAYFIALLFGFDSVTTYIILFFIIGYSLHLTKDPQETTSLNNGEKISAKWIFAYKKRRVVFSLLLIVLAVFLWKYNFKPLIINAQINKAEDLECDKKLSALEKIFSQKSFLDSFLRLKYVENVKRCQGYIVKNDESEYIKKSISALKYSAKIQPNYTRTWILLGQFNTTLAAAETNPQTKNELLEKSRDYFKKAWELSPKRQEALIGLTETYFVAGDYENMKKKSKECRALNEGYAQCHWYLGLSEILLNDEKNGEQNIELAKQKGYNYDSKTSYSQLAIAYTSAKNYRKLVPIYNSLMRLDWQNIQYRAVLAAVYKELGEYKKARETALEIIEIAPEAKDDVNAFLKTLPY